MEILTQLLVYIQIIGGVQGLFLTIILWRLSSEKVFSNRILGLLLIAISYLLIWGALHDSRIIVEIPFLMGTGPAVALTFGPLLYFYTVATINPDFKLSKFDSLHFLPAVVFICTQIPFYLKSFEEKQALILAHYDVHHFNPITGQIPNLQIFIYLVVIVYLLRRHGRNIKEYYSYTEQIRFDWLRNLSYAFTGIWLTFIVVLMFTGIHIAGSVMAILLAAFIYVIGYRGIRQPQVFAVQISIYEARLSSGYKKSKYEKSGLSENDIQTYQRKLENLMETDRIYRNSELTLPDVAGKIDLPTHHLSELLNEYLETNFYDYVNQYRVEEVKEKLSDPANDHLTILALALDAGFKSKSTFYKTFKKRVGMTPTQFKRTSR